MTTGQIVKTARERKGLTPKQLADQAEVSLATIYNIEQDKTSPRMDTMLTIMRTLGYEIKFLKRYTGRYYDD